MTDELENELEESEETAPIISKPATEEKGMVSIVYIGDDPKVFVGKWYEFKKGGTFKVPLAVKEELKNAGLLGVA
jgi:hypothetical protein